MVGRVSPSRWAGIASALCVSVGVGLVGVSDRLARLVAAPPAVPGAAAPEPPIGLPSGNPVVRRNCAATIAALVPPGLAPAELLVRRAGESATLAMSERAPGEWAGTLPEHWTASDCEYAVRAGPGRSVATGWRAVRVADTGELVAVRVTGGDSAADSLEGLRAVAGTRLHFRVEATGPVEECVVRLRVPGRSAAVVALARDGSAWAGTVVAPEVGEETAAPLSLVLVTQHGHEAETAGLLAVAPDRPPELLALAGVLPNPIRLRPGAPLAVELAARDDAAITALAAEWTRPGAGPPVTTPLAGLALPRREFRAPLSLRPPSPEPGPWLVRLALSDRLGARTLVPRAGPLSVEVDPAAPPLATQQRETEARLVAETLAELRAEFAPAEADARALAHAPDPARRRLLGDRLTAQARTLAAADARLSSDAALGAVRPGPLAVRALDLRRAALAGDAAGILGALEAYRADFARREAIQASVAAGRLTLERLAGVAALPADARRGALESLSQSDPWLARAKSADAAAPLAESAKSARDLAAQLAEWVAARDRLAAWQSRRAAAECAGPLAVWSAALDSAQAAASLAATRTGLAPPDAARPRRAAESLAAGNLLDALVEVERAGAEAARLAGHFEAQLAARLDRKEAARQLGRWRQLIAVPGDELDAWRATYRHLAGLMPDAALPPEPPADPAQLQRLLGLVPSRETDRLRALAEVRARRAALAKAPQSQPNWDWLATTELPGAAGPAARLDSARLALADSTGDDRPARLRHLARCLQALEDALAGQTPVGERLATLAAEVGAGPGAEGRRRFRAWRAEIAAIPSPAPLTKAHALECLERGDPDSAAGEALNWLAAIELGCENTAGHVRAVAGLLAARPAGDFAAPARLAADELDGTLAGVAPAERAAALAALRAGNRPAALGALGAWAAALEKSGEVLAFDPATGPPAPSLESRRADWPATRFQPSATSCELLRAAARQSERRRDRLAAAVVEARPTPLDALGDPYAGRSASWLDFAARFPGSPLAPGARALAAADAAAALGEALRTAPPGDALDEATTLMRLETGPDHPAFAANRLANLERDWRRAASAAGADFATRLAPLAGAASGEARAEVAALGAAWRELAGRTNKPGGEAEAAKLLDRIGGQSTDAARSAGHGERLARVGGRLRAALGGGAVEFKALEGELRAALAEGVGP